MPCTSFAARILAASVAAFAVAVLGVSFAPSAAGADPEPGVTRDAIKFGQAAALQGPASALGLDMRAGILSAFAEVNKAGGVKGRKLELVSVDDGYNPAKSVQVTKALIENEKVFALVGPVGAPTVTVALPFAVDAGVPVIAPLSGAEFLRTPFKPTVINVRASYFQETEMMVGRLVQDAGAKRIGILYQNGPFGRVGLEGVQRALAKRGMQLAGEGSFDRNGAVAPGALAALHKGNPDAVILIGPYKPCADFIRFSRQIKWTPLFVSISFVGANALAHELGSDGAGVYITQVAPFPEDASTPLIARYQAALRAVDANARPGFVSLEGYIAGRVIIAGLEKVKGEPTRKAFTGAILAGPINLQGVTLTYGPNDNRGGQEVFLTMIQADGSVKAAKNLAAAVGQ
jgi:branched-chain amino acid transport system substrate-binding protein